MTAESEEFLENKFRLRKALEQVLPQDVINYILDLIGKDEAHRKYLKLVEENET